MLQNCNAIIYLANKLKEIPPQIIHQANIKNPWFTEEFIKLAAVNWSNTLSEDNLNEWTKTIAIPSKKIKVGIIMAGNIPFVGLQDLLCVLVSGHKAVVKLSSQDEVLMKYAIQSLLESGYINENDIELNDKMNEVEKIIATGSNNSARYFEYYFKNIPHIIRKNRTSLAVLSGNETDDELLSLADDIYQYFGLGCRNVSHLMIPQNMDLHRLYTAYDKYIDIVNHHKYYNNYTYHKAILLMNLTKHYDNGFMLFQEKEDFNAPIATLNYHYYQDIKDVHNYINQHSEQWQCVTSNMDLNYPSIKLGQTQTPTLSDYADNVNVLEFLK